MVHQSQCFDLEFLLFFVKSFSKFLKDLLSYIYIIYIDYLSLLFHKISI